MTDSSAISPADLEPGDVLLFNGDTLFAQLVQYFDHTDFFHAAVMTSKTTLAEAVMTGRVVEKAIGDSYVGRTWAAAWRHGDAPVVQEPVVKCARAAVGQHRYGYEDLSALALLCLSRRVPPTASFIPLVGCVLERAASSPSWSALGDEPLVCSGFVEYCYRQAPSPGPYPLTIVSHDGRESVATRGVETGSVLAELERSAFDVDESGIERVTSAPPADQLERLAKAFLDEAKQPGADQASDLEAFSYARLIDPVMRIAERLLGTSTEPRKLSTSLRKLRQVASGLVTPGDLERSPSLKKLGRLPDGGLAPWHEDKIGQLRAAAQAFDRKTAERLCAEMIEWLRAGYGRVPVSQAKEILQLLRRKRWFDLMRTVADALLQSGETAGVVRRQYAQALIEQRDLSAALHVLHALKAECRDDPDESAEASGLIGRVYKQLYVDEPPAGESRKRHFMTEAIRAYYEVYERSKDRWHHGINAVGLLARGKRDRIPVETTADPLAIASDILAAIQAIPTKEASIWDMATAADACIALGREDEALDWVKKYVSAPATDAFELASTLRQLREVWGLSDGHPKHGPLMSVLQAALLAREGTGVEVGGRELRASIGAAESHKAAFKGLERIFDGKYVLYDWYCSGLNRASVVGRIENETGLGIGSGFLIRADLVGLDGGWVFLTNSHVVSRTNTGALPPTEAWVRFEARGPQCARVRVTELLWESPLGRLGVPRPDALDTSILRLDGDVIGDSEMRLAPEDPKPQHDLQKKRRLYIIGYPHGARLALSIEDNGQVGWKEPLLHYRTPTEPGSSGSPIFDDQWHLIGIHHGGRDDMPCLDETQMSYQANEGIWIHAIARAVKR